MGLRLLFPSLRSSNFIFQRPSPVKGGKLGWFYLNPPPAPVPPVLISRQDAQQPAHAGGLTLQPLPKSRLPSASYPWAHMDLSSHSSKAGTPKAPGTYPHHQGYLHGWHKGVVGGNFQNPKQTNWGGILLTGCALSVHRTSRNPSFLVFKTGWGGTKQPYHRLLRAKWVIFINA